MDIVEQDLTRPIIGIEYRSGEEAYAIMRDRIQSAFKSGRIAALTPPLPLVGE